MILQVSSILFFESDLTVHFFSLVWWGSIFDVSKLNVMALKVILGGGFLF